MKLVPSLLGIIWENVVKESDRALFRTKSSKWTMSAADVLRLYTIWYWCDLLILCHYRLFKVLYALWFIIIIIIILQSCRQNACSWSVQLYYSEYSWKFQLLPFVRKYVFAYFLFHVYLWIILDGALNIPIFSRYLRQHYQKIILQFEY